MLAPSPRAVPLARVRFLLAGVDPAPTATRTFLSAFFLLLATPLLLLPAIHMDGTVTEDWARGVVTVWSGVSLLWLGVMRPDRRGYRLAHLAAGAPQMVLGVVLLTRGFISAGTALLSFGLLACLLGPDLGRTADSSAGRRGDVLTLVLLALIVQLGLILIAGQDIALALATVGIDPVPLGVATTVFGAGGLAAVFGGFRRASIVLVWATVALQVIVLGLVVVLVSPAVILVSGSNLLVMAALALYPWRARSHLDWYSLESVLTAAFLTAATMPVMVDVALNHLLDTRTLDPLIRQMQFGALTVLLFVAFLAGPMAARQISRPLAELAAQLKHLGRREPARPIAAPAFAELGAISETIEWLAGELDAERARSQGLIDELRAKNLELQRATAVKDEFLGLVSHELKTPVTTIAGNLAIVLRRDLPPETEDLLADAQLEADRLAGVIDNLLVIARGEGSTDTEPVLLDAVIARALSWLARADPRVMVAVSGDKRLVVEANEAQLTMVLRNLLSNAAKYGGPGQIDLTVRLCGPMATVTVADRGPGIAPEDLEHVFEPFYRAEASSHLVSGLGVGLAVCRRVVEAMGGRCTAGTREGGGAAFSFEVPVAAVGDELEFGVLDGPRALIGADLSA